MNNISQCKISSIGSTLVFEIVISSFIYILHGEEINATVMHLQKSNFEMRIFVH